MTKDKRFIFTLNPRKHQILKIIAIEDGKTMGFIVNQALREFMLKRGVEWDNTITDKCNYCDGDQKTCECEI